MAEPLSPGATRAKDAGARGAPRRITLSSNRVGEGPAAGRDGDLVVVRLAGAPSRGGRRDAKARLTRVIGRQDVARDVIEAVMLDRGLRRSFDEAVEREARQAAERGVRADGRRDLRDVPTLTIDPVTARDFDDAISAQALPDGGATIWVHIADVAGHLPEGSPLDREAQRRATSVYVPGAVEPMLPEVLSGDACSLVPGRERPAVTVELRLRDGDVLARSFYRSLIRSDERLDYDRVDRIFAGAERAAEPWGSALGVARNAAAALGEVRAERAGALELDAPEPEFAFDAQGHVAEVGGRVQTESHRLIEHLMIAANEAVAQLLAERGVPCLYRVHDRPKPQRVSMLIDQLASLEVPTPPAPERISPSQASELVAEISRGVAAYLRGAQARARAGDRAIPATGGRLALSSLVLRSLQQAVYSPKNIGHAGLGSTCYCHFTSPIRRYPDIVCHRALLSVLDGSEPAPRAAALGELGEWTSAREREAMTIERDTDDVARCFALQAALYEEGFETEFQGEVTGLISAGAFIAFGEPWPAAAHGEVAMPPPYEGMLPVRRLQGGDGRREWWELNALGTVLEGERTGASIRLGQARAVRVARVDPLRGRVDLADAGRAG